MNLSGHATRISQRCNLVGAPNAPNRQHSAAATRVSCQETLRRCDGATLTSFEVMTRARLSVLSTVIHQTHQGKLRLSIPWFGNSSSIACTAHAELSHGSPTARARPDGGNGKLGARRDWIQEREMR